MTLPVYFVDWLSDAAGADQPPLALLGRRIEFEGDEARHAATVRRTRVGEHIDLVDGQGLRATIEVTEVDKARLGGVVTNVSEDRPHDVHITLIQALSKGGRDEQAIETATEYGVDAVMPWQADRSVARWEGISKISRGMAKWESTVLTAAKQSRRSWLPAVEPFVDSKALVQWVRHEVAAGTRVYMCHEEAVTPLVECVRSLEIEPAARLAYIVGPEGGISEQEVEALEAAGVVTVLLGEHVMRASSAGSWAIAVTRGFLSENSL